MRGAKRRIKSSALRLIFLVREKSGSKCDGFAVTFTLIEVPAALASASAAGERAKDEEKRDDAR